MHLINTIKNFIITNNLIRRGETLLVGVSGGADSLTLLHVLHSLRSELGFHLHVAHYDHNLRKTSKRDRLFVEKVSQSLGLPFSCETWEHPPSNPKGSLEELCREKRLAFLTKTAKKIHTKKIALAHNKDDLAETVLMSILRGTGLKGLRGILPKREYNDFILLRPLLDTGRKEIELFLKKRGLAFQKDETNNQTIFFRNKVRLELLPLLEKNYNKKIKDALCHLAQTSSVDFHYLDVKTEKYFSQLSRISKDGKKITLDLIKFKSLPQALNRMLIRKCIETLKGNTNRLTFSHCLDIECLINIKPVNSIVDLPSGVQITKKNNSLILTLN